jgi:hypothetical protein
MHTWLVALIAAAATSSGPVYSGAERNLRVAVPRLEASVEVDGHLSEPAWEHAARLTSFSQYAPDDSRAAIEQTEVLVWYAPTAIHFGIRAHAAPGTVRATLADRDRIENDDWVQIYLATFNDGRQASVFGVNPLGVQLDGAIVEGTGGQGGSFGGLAAGRPSTDLSPDFVFDSKGRLTPEGYEVEIRIPFKSLRYQGTSVQDWGIHVIRRVQNSGHEDSWAPARRSAASFLAQAGTLAALTDLRRGLVMDLNPVVTARADGREEPSGWTYNGRQPEFGGNVRWGVTSNLTFNATLNPDFSQVEADATQFQIDPRQALFFAEKRPFFLDGIEFFSTPNSLVYSRRIVEPIVAAKLTGKAAGTTIAALTAVDDRRQSFDGRSHPWFNVLRVQRDLAASSRAGFVYTSRIDGDATNQVAGADAHLVWRTVYALDLQAAVSRTDDGATASSGTLWQGLFSRSGRRFSARYSLRGNAPDFRAATGFIGRQGIIDGNLTHQVALYGKPGALVERWTGDVQLLGFWRYDDFTAGRPALERKLHVNANFFLKRGWRSGFSVLVERYGFDPSIYGNYGVLDGDVVRPFVGASLPNLDYVFSLNTPRIRGVSLNIFHIWGRDENFYEWSSANIVYSTASLRWRPTERLRADVDYNLQSFARRTDGSYVGIRRIPRLKLEYQATRAIFVRYVGEYATNYQDALRDDSRTGLPIVFVAADGSFRRAEGLRQRTFRNDWLFSYQPTPGTVLFAGYGNSLANLADPLSRTLHRTRDGFFLKLSYLFRL